MRIRRCVQCGKLFQAGSNSAKYCSDGCREKYKRPPGSGNGEVIRVAEKAAAAGMSYGKFVAARRIAKMRRRENERRA